MKTQTDYTTPITLTLWIRQYRTALVAVLALVATIIGLLYALGFSVSTPRPAADHAVRTPTQGLIANCQPCRDEALAAQVKAAAQPVRVAHAVHTTIGGLIANCRACRDEVLSANQASLCTAEGATVFSQQDDPRRPGPR
jgi:hypothetical protein